MEMRGSFLPRWLWSSVSTSVKPCLVSIVAAEIHRLCRVGPAADEEDVAKDGLLSSVLLLRFCVMVVIIVAACVCACRSNATTPSYALHPFGAAHVIQYE